MQNKNINILLIEDNPGDIELIRNAFEELEITPEFQVMNNGQLVANQIDSGLLHADIILLDINIPKLNGFEILELLKGNSRTKLIPVIMLTSSSAEDDIYKSYSAGASCFLTKPADYLGLIDMINTFSKFWLNMVHLPKLALR